MQKRSACKSCKTGATRRRAAGRRRRRMELAAARTRITECVASQAASCSNRDAVQHCRRLKTCRPAPRRREAGNGDQPHCICWLCPDAAAWLLRRQQAHQGCWPLPANGGLPKHCLPHRADVAWCHLGAGRGSRLGGSPARHFITRFTQRSLSKFATCVANFHYCV